MKQEFPASFLHFCLIIENFDGYLFTLSLSYGPHKNPNLLDDSPLPAYDLANIAVSYTDFENRLTVGCSLGHRNPVRIIDEILHNIGQ